MAEVGLLGPSNDLDAPVHLAVVLPCRDVADTLPEQLDRLVDERWTRPWCIVVVDNGSTDGTAEVARRYADRGVRLVTATSGAGVGYARNAGARAVSSAAIAFCDGDDIVHRGWVAAMGDALERDELVGGRVDTTSLNEPWLARSRPMASSDGLARFAETPFAPGCSCGVRRDLYDRLGGFDESFQGLEDVELSLRARALGVQARLAPGAVVAYRLRADPRLLWRQATFYGRGHPLLIRRASELGLPAPSRLRGLRSWAWLLLHLPSARSRAGRYALLWVLAFRVGVLRTALRLRRPYV